MLRILIGQDNLEEASLASGLSGLSVLFLSVDFCSLCFNLAGVWVSGMSA
jgi:hypothetical protein